MYEIEEKKREKLISMGNSSTLTDDEIQNNKNKGNCIINFPFSPALPSCSIFDIIPPQSDDDHQKSSSSFAGYIDMLSTDDFTVTSSSSLLDWFPNSAFDADDTSAPAAQINQLPLPSPAVSDVLNTNPATPISVSSSISSSSSEACVANKPVAPVAGNEHELELLEEDEEGDEEEAEDKDEDHAITITHVENQNQRVQTKKLLKPRKKKSTKERAARVSFKTRSDVDHLDDGYRWRKYGQKPVKNSPYPRSYYRCTTAGCGVKKRLERSAMEPSCVLTSYEGQHTHFSPILTRAAELGFVTNASSFHEKNYQHHRNTVGVGSGVLGNQFPMASQSQPQHFQHFQNQNQNVLHQQNQQQAASSSLFNNYNNSYNVAPPLNNVVNSADNFMDHSTSFGGFLQNQENYGGSSSESSCLRINLRDLVSDVGLLQDMIAPKEMAGAGAGAGEGRIDGDVNFMFG